MKKYIVGYYTENSNSAGGKFPKDIICVFIKNDYQHINVHEAYPKRNLLKSFNQIFTDILNLSHIKTKSLVVYIDQVRPRLSKYLSFVIFKLKKCDVVDFLEDVEFLRNNYSDSKIKHCIKTMNGCKCVISQNNKMSKELRRRGLRSQTFELNILDFLSNVVDVGKERNVDSKWSVCYGGNLSSFQSGFIFKLPYFSSVIFYVYGPNLPSKDLPQGCEFKGTFDAENCVGHIKGDWGLVWNGNDIFVDENDKKSTYYNYVCPHKLSMYLLCGMPVIVYKESAMANFVIQNKCGIVVNNLKDLDKVLSEINEKMYQQLKRGALEIASRIAVGKYTSNVINEMERYLR